MRRLSPVLLLLALLLAGATLAGCDSNAASGDTALSATAEAFPRGALYVCNQSDATISVIDTDDNAVTDTLDLRDYPALFADSVDAANAKPHHVVVEPDGAAFYVSLIGADAVAKFDRRGRLVGQAAFEAPGMLALAPGGRLYAGHTMSLPNVPSTVAAIRRADMTLDGAPIEVFIDRPHGIGAHPGGEIVYTGSLAENRIATIDTETRATEFFAQGGSRQTYNHFALSPDGGRLYATGQTAGTLRTFDVSAPATPRLLETVAVNPEPWHPVLSADGQTLYFGNKAAGTVTVFDTEAGAVETVVENDALQQPHGSALAPSGRFLYVSNNVPGGTVAVIDTRTHAVVKTLAVGADPAGLGTRTAVPR